MVGNPASRYLGCDIRRCHRNRCGQLSSGPGGAEIRKQWSTGIVEQHVAG